MQLVASYPEFFIATMFGVALLFRSMLEGSSGISQTLRETAKAAVYLMPERYLAWLQRNQTWAGWRSGTAFSTVASIKLYSALLVGFALALVHPLIGIALAGIVFFIPDVAVVSRRFSRQREVVTSLPQALDLLVLCVDAGLGLDAALHKVAAEQSVLSEALGEELATLNRDILLGMDRDRAYEDLFARTGVEELRTVGSALAQSGKLGLSVGQVIRAQSEFIRTRQHQRAEERASKLSIWMVFPLWFCIMPALMIILLAPPLFLFFKNVAHFPPEWFM